MNPDASPFRAARDFFGREKELVEFEKMIRTFDPESSKKNKVLVHARSGMGKSRLLAQYQQICFQNEVKHIFLDLKSENVNSFVTLLVEMRAAYIRQVLPADLSKNEANKVFADFDASLKKHKQSRLTDRRINIQDGAETEHPVNTLIAEQDDTKSEFWSEFTEETPEREQHKKGFSLKSIFFGSSMKEPEVITKERLAQSLWADLKRNCGKEKFLIFLDSYERLKYQDPDIFNCLITFMPTSFVVVVSGQEHLMDSAKYPHWQKRKEEVIFQEITRLSSSETKDLIRRKLDATLCTEGVLRVIEEQTQGIPYLLPIVIDSAKNRSFPEEIIESLEDLNLLRDLDKGIIEVVKDWLQELPTAQQTLLFYASVLRKFNHRTLRQLLKNTTEEDWNAFITTSFVIDLKRPTITYSIHDQYRKHIRRYLELNDRYTYVEINNSIQEYFQPLASNHDVIDPKRFEDEQWLENLREYIYHLLQSDREVGVERLLGEVADAVWFLNYDFALELLMSFENQVDRTEREWFDLLKDALIAEKGQESEVAIGKYKELLESGLTAEKVPLHAQCLDSIGSIYMNLGKWQQAIDYLSKVGKFFGHLNSEFKVATVELHLATAYQSLGHSDQQREHGQNALQGFQQLYKHSKSLYCKLNEAVCLRILDKNEDANKLFVKLSRNHDFSQKEDFLEAWFDHLCRTEQWQRGIDIGELFCIKTKSVEKRAYTYEMVGDIYRDHLEDLKSAIQSYEQGYTADANRSSLLWGKINAYYRFEQWEDALSMLSYVAEHIEEERVPALESKGDLLRDRKDLPEEAISYYKEALAIDPERFSTKVELIKTLLLLEQNEKATELVVKLEQSIGADQVADWEVLGNLFRQSFGDNEKAIACYDKGLQADPYYRPILARKVNVFRDCGEWNKAISVLEFIIKNIAEDRAEAQEALGDIYRDNLRQLDKAIQVYRECLKAYPERIATKIELCVALLKYDQKEEATKLRAEISVEIPKDDAQLWEKFGDLLRDHFKDADLALEAYDRSLASEPYRLSILGEKFNLYRDLEEWDKAINILQTSIDHVPSSEANALEIMANIYRDNKKELEKALELYDRSLAIPPVRFSALLGKAKTLLLLGEKDQALTVIEKFRSITPHEKAARWEELGDLYRDDLHDPEAAIQAYNISLSAKPERQTVIWELIATYARQDEKEEATSLIQQLERDTPRHNAPGWEKIGDLYQDELKDPANAIRSYDRSLLAEPNRKTALIGKLNAYRASEEWNSAISILEHISKTVEEDKAEAQEALADLYRVNLQDPLKAIEVYQRCLESEPERYSAKIELIKTLLMLDREEEAMKLSRELENEIPVQDAAGWERFGNLLRDHFKNSNKALEAYERGLLAEPARLSIFGEKFNTYRDSRQWEEAIAVLQSSIELIPSSAANALQVMADIFRDNLDQKGKALELYDQCLAIRPPRPVALLGKAKVLISLNRKEEALVLLREFEQNLDAKAAREWEQLGDLYRDQLVDPQSAKERYLNSIQAEPKRPSALGELVRTHGQLGEVEEARNIIEELEASVSKMDAVNWELIGDLYRDSLGSPEKALEAYSVSLVAEPTRFTAHQELITTLMQLEQTSDALAATGKLESIISEQDVEGWEVLGNVYRDHIKDVARAIEAYDRSLSIDPLRSSTLRGKYFTYRNNQMWEEAIKVLKEVVERIPEDRVDALCILGDIYNDQMKDPSEAIGMYQRSIEIDPLNFSTWIKLLDFFYEKGRQAEIIETYRKIAEQFPDKRHLVWSELALIHQSAGQFAEAKNFLMRIKDAEVDKEFRHKVELLFIGDSEGGDKAGTYWKEHDRFSLGTNEGLLEQLSDRILLEMNPENSEHFDPEKGSVILPLISSLRHKLVDECGFIIPAIRVRESDAIPIDKYQIWFTAADSKWQFSILGQYAVQGTIPGVEGPVSDELGIDQPLTWLSLEAAENLRKTGIASLSFAEIVIRNLEKVLVDNQHLIWAVTRNGEPGPE